MDTRKYYAYNQTRECFLSGELKSLDAGREPLRVLKVLIEGLAPHAKSGLWLTHFRSVPVARTLSPFDLVYLDSELRVVHSIELTTDGEFSPFKGQPSSALVLPPQSIFSSQTRTGDQLIIRLADEAASRSRETPAQTSVASDVPEPAPKMAEGASHAVQDDSTVSPLEQFLARQSSIAGAHGRVQQNARSLLELSPTERAPVPPVPPPVAQSGAPALAEPSEAARPTIHAVPPPGPIPVPPARESRSGPARGTRISPPPGAAPWLEGSPPAIDAPPSQAPTVPSQQPTASGPQLSRSKVEPFPARRISPPPNAPSHPIEPLFRPSDIEESAPAPPEKTSVLMRILRLQFLSRQRATQQDLPTLQPAAPEKAHGAGRTIPAWGMRFLRWLYPDYDIATGADTAIQASAYTANTRFQPDARLSLDMQFVKWLYPEIAFRRPDRKAPPRDRRLAGRLPKPGLVAYYFTGGPPRARDIGNISVTGFYMQTEERWMPGTIIRMTLQLADPRGDEPLDSLTVHSRVVRWGSDGEAFEFVLAGFLDEPLPLSYRRAEPPPRPHDS